MDADRLRHRVATLALVGGLAALTVNPVVAQDGTQAQDGVSSVTTMGIEQGDWSAALRALFERQQRMSDNMAILEARINTVANQANQTEARIARGDDPLVALEIEQLWSLVRSLERENAVLKERLDALGAPNAGGQP